MIATSPLLRGAGTAGQSSGIPWVIVSRFARVGFRQPAAQSERGSDERQHGGGPHHGDHRVRVRVQFLVRPEEAMTTPRIEPESNPRCEICGEYRWACMGRHLAPPAAPVCVQCGNPLDPDGKMGCIPEFCVHTRKETAAPGEAWAEEKAKGLLDDVGDCLDGDCEEHRKGDEPPESWRHIAAALREARGEACGSWSRYGDGKYLCHGSCGLIYANAEEYLKHIGPFKESK